MITTSNKLKALALGLLSVASVSAFAQGGAPGTAAYDTWKHNQIPAAALSAAPITTSINAAPTGTAPGCYFAPDGTYSELPGNDDGSTGTISLPFTFCLYGSNFTSCNINNNGNITFDGPTSQYSASGFPFSSPMVAAFWGDVDTRCGNTMKYKVEAHRLIATWPAVGVFSNNCALSNTFQIIISDGLDAGIGIGNNVAFYYGDMQWTTGTASGGSGGFGGTPATVGLNNGNGVNYVQIGRFNQANASYDGGGGADDGVDYLDYECYTFAACGSGTNNLPPSVSGAPAGNTITIPVGTTGTINLSFLPPEVAQQVSTLINTGGLCNTVINTNTSGAVSNTSVSITGDACNLGTHHIIYTATDDFGTPASTTVDITVVITPNTNVPTISQWGLMILCLLSLAVGMIFIYKKENSLAIN